MPIQPALDADELEFIDDMLTEWHATDNARAVARFNMRTFARWLAAERPGTRLADVTQADCVAFLKHRSTPRPDGTCLAASTVAKNWSDLRAFYNAAEGDITDPLNGRRSPMTRIKMPRMPKYALTHAATVSEVDALIASFDKRNGIGLRNAAMVSLMFRSGLRVSEVAHASLHDLDLDARRINLPMTKNLIPRQPTLHPETLALMKRYLRRRGDRPGPLFVSAGVRSKSEALPTGAIQTIVKRHAAKAGVPVTPHTLRRGFVVEYLTHGGDIATLMIIGGWSSETMIVRYMGDQRAQTAQAVYDVVAQRQVASRRRLAVA